MKMKKLTAMSMAVMMAATIVVFIFALTGKIKRSDGIALLCMYGAYLAYLIVRTIM